MVMEQILALIPMGSLKVTLVPCTLPMGVMTEYELSPVLLVLLALNVPVVFRHLAPRGPFAPLRLFLRLIVLWGLFVLTQKLLPLALLASTAHCAPFPHFHALPGPIQAQLGAARVFFAPRDNSLLGLAPKHVTIFAPWVHIAPALEVQTPVVARCASLAPMVIQRAALLAHPAPLAPPEVRSLGQTRALCVHHAPRAALVHPLLVLLCAASATLAPTHLQGQALAHLVPSALSFPVPGQHQWTAA